MNHKFRLSIAKIDFPPGKIPLIATGIEAMTDTEHFVSAVNARFNTDCFCVQFLTATAIRIGFLAPLMGSIEESFRSADKALGEIVDRFDDQERDMAA